MNTRLTLYPFLTATLIDWENAVVVIYINKVSDRVCHEIVNKVVNYGLNDPTIRWIYNWLTDHSHSSTLFSIIPQRDRW